MLTGAEEITRVSHEMKTENRRKGIKVFKVGCNERREQIGCTY